MPAGTQGAEVMDRDATTQPENGVGNFLDQAPKVSDALKRGGRISVTTWGGQTIFGVVSDRDTAGLLMEVEGDDTSGFAFLPWSSVERVDIPEIVPRQVKFLQG